MGDTSCNDSVIRSYDSKPDSVRATRHLHQRPERNRSIPIERCHRPGGQLSLVGRIEKHKGDRGTGSAGELARYRDTTSTDGCDGGACWETRPCYARPDGVSHRRIHRCDGCAPVGRRARRCSRMLEGGVIVDLGRLHLRPVGVEKQGIPILCPAPSVWKGDTLCFYIAQLPVQITRGSKREVAIVFLSGRTSKLTVKGDRACCHVVGEDYSIRR